MLGYTRIGVIVDVDVEVKAGEKEPIGNVVWLALYGKKIGKIMPKELEEESLVEQEKLSR